MANIFRKNTSKYIKYKNGNDSMHRICKKQQHTSCYCNLTSTTCQSPGHQKRTGSKRPKPSIPNQFQRKSSSMICVVFTHTSKLCNTKTCGKHCKYYSHLILWVTQKELELIFMLSSTISYISCCSEYCNGICYRVCFIQMLRCCLFCAFYSQLLCCWNRRSGNCYLVVHHLNNQQNQM